MQRIPSTTSIKVSCFWTSGMSNKLSQKKGDLPKASWKLQTSPPLWHSPDQRPTPRPGRRHGLEPSSGDFHSRETPRVFDAGES